jgi:hypothetical protein
LATAYGAYPFSVWSIVMPVKPGRAGVSQEMSKFKAGNLHSGSAKGPVVTDPQQAIAISLSEAGLSNKKPKKVFGRPFHGRDT